MNPRKGATPVPVATMMTSASGDSGSSRPLPTGPVSATTSPGLPSQRKFEQMPFFAGSSALSSGHQ